MPGSKWRSPLNRMARAEVDRVHSKKRPGSRVSITSKRSISPVINLRNMAGELSRTVYDTRDKAAIGGFLSVREHHKTEWGTKEFGFLVVLVMDKTKVTYHYTEPEAGEGTRVNQDIPPGLNARGFCHTHPKSDSTGDFSRRARSGIRRDARSRFRLLLLNCNHH